jgi:hypothetical protein
VNSGYPPPPVGYVPNPEQAPGNGYATPSGAPHAAAGVPGQAPAPAAQPASLYPVGAGAQAEDGPKRSPSGAYSVIQSLTERLGGRKR